MQIKVLKKEKGYVKINVKQTDPHTLFNLLREELLKDDTVDFAGYWRDESFYESVIFQVKMKKKTADPIPAINNALDRLKEQTEDFIKACKEKIE
jgi:DNA-directed RNA polymerase subunit L